MSESPPNEIGDLCPKSLMHRVLTLILMPFRSVPYFAISHKVRAADLTTTDIASASAETQGMSCMGTGMTTAAIRGDSSSGILSGRNGTKRGWTLPGSSAD